MNTACKKEICEMYDEIKKKGAILLGHMYFIVKGTLGDAWTEVCAIVLPIHHEISRLPSIIINP